MPRTLITIALVAVAAHASAPVALAQAVGEAVGEAPATGDSVTDIIFAGGVIGFLIVALLLLLSVCGMALAVEHLLTIRRSVLMPDALVAGLASRSPRARWGRRSKSATRRPARWGRW